MLFLRGRVVSPVHRQFDNFFPSRLLGLFSKLFTQEYNSQNLRRIKVIYSGCIVVKMEVSYFSMLRIPLLFVIAFWGVWLHGTDANQGKKQSFSVTTVFLSPY